MNNLLPSSSPLLLHGIPNAEAGETGGRRGKGEVMSCFAFVADVHVWRDAASYLRHAVGRGGCDGDVALGPQTSEE